MNYKLLFILVALFIPGRGYVKAQNDSTNVKTVSGIVLDMISKQPVAFASVTCGEVSSSFTDMDGAFSLQITGETDVVSVNLVGYHSKDVIVAGKDSLIIYLKESTSFSFQEELNTGYFDIKQLYTTQSVAGVNHLDDLKKQMASSAEVSFDGRVAGVNAIERNGIKGLGSDLFIRGYSSLYSSNQPLVVVDGMMYDINTYGTSMIPGSRSNALGGIDLNDIESVSVLRDAASIYGAKAANGVILIRTNHANKQATSIDFAMSGGIEQMPSLLPLMDAEQYRLYTNEMLISSGLSLDSVAKMPFLKNDATAADYYTYRNNTDWQKKVFKDNYSSNYGLVIKGGDDVALYALNVGYMKQGGTVDDSDFSRFNLRFNSDINISKRLTLNSNIGFYYIEKSITGTGLESVADPVHQARIKAPFLQPYQQSETGIVSPDYSDYDLFGVSNPVSLLSGMEQNSMNYRLSGSFNFDVKVNDNLDIQNLVGIVFDKTRENVFIPSEGVAPDTVTTGVIENRMKTRVLRHMVVNNDLRATYSNRFNYNHGLKAVVGARLSVNNLEEDWGADYNSANDQIHTLGSGNYLLRQKGGFIGEWSNLNLYLNANYDFKKRYFLTASLSLDGNSRFGAEADGISLFDTVFGIFPSVSGAWLVSAEPFMNQLNWVDVFKIRASYGLTGNDDIGNYTSKRYYNTINFLGYQGSTLGNLWNPELGYEKNTKTNVGFDLALLKERLSLSVDYYQSKTTDMFDYVTSDYYSGFEGYYANIGGVTTTGMDFFINGRIINKPFKWDLGVVVSNFTTNVDELWHNKRLSTFYGANILTAEGQPLNQFYGYKTQGVFSTSEAASASGLSNLMDNGTIVPFGAGDMIFEDRDGDFVIDENDMQVIGDPTPDLFGEMSSSMRYKRLSLDASVSFSYGGDVFNYMRYTMEQMTGFDNQIRSVLNRWQYEGQMTEMPKASFGDPMGNNRFSDRWIEDGSYVRLKSVTLSYKIPLHTSLFKNMEAYITGLNLYTFTDYKGLDPEFSAGGSALVQGIDLGMVPQNRTFLVGLKIGL
ncbi:SusC/RagA family TonB-linked outer membrane protein [Geofilum sp. OHC36d9]|uniref:SusC/RagA family TonB-linked outer membrane protein n=1 Tax=Geofilum sp. OHC36d9 TaxID=3458413 RepID=UPI004034B462